MKCLLSQMHTQSVAWCISFCFCWSVLLIFCLCLIRQVRPCLPFPSLLFSRQRIKCIVWYVFLVIWNFHCQKGTNNFMSKDYYAWRFKSSVSLDVEFSAFFGAFALRVSRCSETDLPSMKVLQSFEMLELLTYHVVISQKTWIWNNTAVRTWLHIIIHVK